MGGGGGGGVVTILAYFSEGEVKAVNNIVEYS